MLRENDGVCRFVVENKSECVCSSDFTGTQCEIPVNTNPVVYLEKFCSRAYGDIIHGYCYMMKEPDVFSKMAGNCAENKGRLMQFTNPEFLNKLLQSFQKNLPTTAVAMGVNLTLDSCGHSVPDPVTTSKALLAQLAQWDPSMFSGVGCAMLTRVSPAIYKAIGGACDQASKYICQYDDWRWTPVVKYVKDDKNVPPYLLCLHIKCYAERTITCNDANDTCICKPGWGGKYCEMNIDYCNPNPCRFYGTCTDTGNNYKCSCIDGFGGTNCQIATGISNDPYQIYNRIVQGVGCGWVIGAAGFTVVFYLFTYDPTPESTLKRHHLLALLFEHLLIMNARSPVIMDISSFACNWASLLMIYFRCANTLLLFFQCIHVYFITTGVTYGNWGWGGKWWVFLSLGWGLPAYLVFLIYVKGFNYLGTGFSCMMDWSSTLPRIIWMFIPIMLLSFKALEQAHMDQDLQPRHTRNLVNPVELQVAKVGRLGNMFIVMLAPLSYWCTSMAVYTGSPHFYSGGFGVNVGLGVSIVSTYIVSNPVIWANIMKCYRSIKQWMESTFQRKKKEETAMELAAPPNMEEPQESAEKEAPFVKRRWNGRKSK